MNKQTILILCTGNSARSQMAEGLMRHALGERFDVASAGTHPSSVRPEAIAVMGEIGIDLSTQRSKSVDEFAAREFTYVITVCDNARDVCPIFPGKTRKLHWPFEDPAAIQGPEEVRHEAFRKVRDRIRRRVEIFQQELA